MLTLHTIGHGRHSFADFLSLLQQYEIQIVCDVRSAARSRWVQFNEQILAAALNKHHIAYEHLPECGGKVVAAPQDLARGLDHIIELAGEARIALMCSESQPLTKHKIPRANCHRVGLLSTPLKARGAQKVIHILPDANSLMIDESRVPSIWRN